VSLRHLPTDIVPDVPEDAVAAMRASRDVFLVFYGRRSAPSTRDAIKRVASAIATGAWS
jgi:hypothetical protein